MDPALTTARHFARLVGLLVREPANVEEQKATLRALVLAGKEGPVSLEVADGQLLASGVAVPAAFPGVAEVVARMAAHGLQCVGCETAAGPAELLGVARLLAGAHAANDFGAAAQQQLAALNAPNVRFVPRRDPGALPELELVDVPDEVLASAPRRTRATPTSGAGGGGGLFDQFGKAPPSDAPPEQLLAELATANDSTRLDHLLDYLVQAAERALVQNKPLVVADILRGIARRDAGATDAMDKRLIALAKRKLARPPLLQAVARQLPRMPEERERLMAALAWMGDEGADTLIEQLATAQKQSDRRSYFEALVQLQAGVPTLIHMLGDTRWYVVRNAADLLGEMQAREAEQPLTWLLQHADERVRHSATAALMRMGTPRALQAIQEALRDPAPQTRIQASAALLTRKDTKNAAIIVKALDAEKDEAVQDALLVALGRLGTPDAVQRLVAAVEPERGFFRSKRTGYRVAAVQGLAESRTAPAMEALNALLADKEAEVRDAATFALGRIARSGEKG